MDPSVTTEASSTQASDTAHTTSTSVNPHPDHVAWNAVANGDDSTTVHGATISSPSITFQPPDRILSKLPTQPTDDERSKVPDATSEHPPPEGFILNGTIELFGISGLKADFYSHHGPVSAAVDLTDGTIPIYQAALLDEDLRLSTIFPEFSGTDFNVFNFKETTFTYQNIPVDRTKDVGLTIEAVIVFDSSYGKIHDVLSKFLGVADPTLRVGCTLGIDADWHEPLQLSSLAVEGVFPSINPPPLNGLTFTSIGARLIGFHCVNYSPAQTSAKEYGYALFGTLNLNIPGSATPLALSYDISEIGETLTLSAELDTAWENAFGVKSLTLQEVSLSVELNYEVSNKELTFDISAVIDAGDTSVYLEGSLSTNGDFYLTATADDLGLSGINDLFFHLFGEDLTAPDVDIYIGEATITISKDKGFSLQIHDLQIGEHTSDYASVSFGSKGAVLKASLTDDVLKFGELQVTKAFAQVSFGRFETEAKADVLLGGEFEWEGYIFDVGVHVYTSTDGKDTLEYTIYGQFSRTSDGTSLSSSFPLSTLVSVLKGNPLGDIVIENVALIIASCDDPEFGVLNHSGYPVLKGIQVCAELGAIDAFTKITGGQHFDLILRAAWSKERGFDLDICLHADTILHLGHGVTTDPIAFGIDLSEPPSLIISTGAIIPVEKQVEPLHFTLEMELNEIGASATGQLKAVDGWKNPFGLSEDITAGPDLALKVGIIYETFLEQGPSELGFVGGFLIGKTGGQLAFQASDIPSQEFLYIEVTNLDLQNLTDFANTIAPRLHLPQPPNVMEFEDVKAYVCSTGVTIGTLVYPPGFSFSARVTLFGIKADAALEIGNGGFHCSGGIDPFSLAGGAIQVAGYKTDRASYDLEFTKDKLGGTVDGVIKLFGLECKMSGTLQMHPQLIIDFQFELDFGSIFQFIVHAGPMSELSEGASDVTQHDSYQLTAEFHSELRDHVSEQIGQMFKDMEKKAQEAADEEKAELEQKRLAWEAEVDAKQKELDDLMAVWTKKNDETHAKFDQTMAAYLAKIVELQGALDAASAKLKASIAEKQAALSAANASREAKLRDEENSLRTTKSEWDIKLQDAHQRLDTAAHDLQSGFGNIEHDVDVAIKKVDSLQNSINDINNHISNAENAHWWDLAAKASLPGLFAEKLGLEAAKGIADGVLAVARAVFLGAQYATCKGGLELASKFLIAVQAGADTAIHDAEAALEEANRLTNTLVAGLQAALTEAGKLGQVAIDEASTKLTSYKAASVAVIRDAQAAVDVLNTCSEWLVCTAAKASLMALKAAGSGLYEMTEVAVAVVEDTEQLGMEVSSWMLQHMTELINITDINLTAQVGKGVGGLVFDAVVKGTAGGEHQFSLEVKFDTSKIGEFLKALFDKIIAWIKATLM
ncbi:hypothetical protein SISSUDRAFT_1061095 [Sistotremastrum suecicum HHB10207 ss-3]|uniref:Uncharacterized protein n=1 Tax=Sistotremastrum suecicum HHB10207 ss-3 TaxID=1314776 RepID=A0A166EE67_9AGAM|nr:hypothetical protein SISSUDRAFT_1061095 [Sistotremastrum suecicum HHB10207 ss-3]